jgi:hypothetical protein
MKEERRNSRKKENGRTKVEREKEWTTKYKEERRKAGGTETRKKVGREDRNGQTKYVKEERRDRKNGTKGEK